MSSQRKTRRIFIPNIDGGDLMENFIISAVFTILVIRIFLFATGYPQLGGNGLHIAHMLWGGLFLVIALYLLLSFLDRRQRIIASVVGGIGFGTFIDELGKFITDDNDYFFQPTIALIYIIFILMFLAIRGIQRLLVLHKEDYAVNAIDIMKELILFDLDKHEKEKALEYLKLSDQQNEFIKSMHDVLKKSSPDKDAKVSYIVQIRYRSQEYYTRIIKNKHFSSVLMFLFIAGSLINLAQALYSTFVVDSLHSPWYILASTLGGILVLIGVYYQRKKQLLTAYEFYKYSILFSLLVVQIFLFYENQLLAFFQFCINLTVYIVIRYLIDQEKTYQKHQEATNPIVKLKKRMRNMLKRH